MNPADMMKMASRLRTFQAQHPKAIPFLQMLSGGPLREGSVLEVKVTDPEGKEYVSNIRVTAEDMETVAILKGMKQ